MSANQLAYILIELRRSGWHVRIARVNTAKLIGKCSHLLILSILLCNLQALSGLLTIIQIIRVRPLATFLVWVHDSTCLVHASEISHLCVVLSVIFDIVVAACLVEKSLGV